MKILSISSDRKLFESGSEVQKRTKDYGKLFDELHIVVFADKKLGFSDLELDGNIFVYPTNHSYKFLYLWNIYKIVKSLIVSRHVSVVTTQDPFEAGFAGWLLKFWLKTPLQIQIHTDIFSPYFSGESFTNKLRVFLAKFLLTRANGIRVVSERIRNSLNSNVRGHLPSVSVLPVFVDVKKIQSAKIKINLHEKYPNHDFIILMASRLTKEKNIGMAIRALDKIKGQISNVKNPLLLIVGDGPEKENIKLQITNYQLQNNVIIEPWTNDLISYYKTADLFLLTSNYEGYGRTIIESISAGLPVIMTNVGLAGDVVVNDLDGVVIDINDVEALSGAILDLAGDSDLMEEFRKNGSKLAENLLTKQEYLEQYKKSLMMLK